jgi:hypothetical protein
MAAVTATEHKQIAPSRRKLFRLKGATSDGARRASSKTARQEHRSIEIPTRRDALIGRRGRRQSMW